MEIKAIIFDLDQTLIYTLRRFYKVFNNTLKRFVKKEVSWDIFLKYYNKDDLNLLIESNVNPVEFWQYFRKIYSTFIDPEDRLVEGATEILEYLKNKGYKIFVTTGREANQSDIWKELEYFGISKFVDNVFTLSQQDPRQEKILFSKEGLISYILKKYNLKPQEVLFVADYWVDMVSGKKTNVITVGIITSHEDAEKLKKHGAVFVIRKLGEIKDIISKLENSNKS
ncbi:MAG: HAD family hydrolase [Candidatus Asgardarchaeia archaeon]